MYTVRSNLFLGFIRLRTSASTSVTQLANRPLSRFSISTNWHRSNLWYSTYRARRFAWKHPKYRCMCSQYICDRGSDCTVSPKESCCWYVQLPFFLPPPTVHHSWPEPQSGSFIRPCFRSLIYISILRPHRTANVPRNLPFDIAPPTNHQRIAARTRHHAARRTDSCPCRFCRRPVLGFASQRYCCNPGCGRWDFE